ncbi:ABC transporter substrate-binding protein [Halalkalibacter alkaliphilus]|uniref:ABC transporter substrate-binding protein n=1 Tax=Halalkalibacter alkaliphilus TaxID=2917993 RepID=A0A9X2IA04_9BACI|nr:ABC transporter substrate-binding protein [Halalkalibacter alkaliphilus]MCL7749769.1 ABC transporter substrate-binding protein [Halalkalibacter alkaliphilus]
MIRKFKLLSLLFITLLLILSACNKSSSTDVSEEREDQPKGDEVTEEPTELTVAFYIHGETPRDLQLVEDKVSEHTLDKINAKVNLMPISIGDYQQQMNLMLSGNENLDLLITSGRMGFIGFATRGQLLELDELIEEYGVDIQNILPEEYLSSLKLKGKTYGIPNLKDMAGKNGINMRVDLLEKHNIDVNNIKTLADVESVLRKIKENEPGVDPNIHFGPNVHPTNFVSWFDNLGDFFGVLPDDTDNLELVNLYETPEYEEFVKTMRNWYTDGLIMPDIATSTESVGELMGANRGFSYFSAYKPGIDEQESRKSGTPMKNVTFDQEQPYSYTHHLTGQMWSIGRNSKAPEKAMELLNLMFVDEELVNLLNWGIEGVHYEKVADNVIVYPEGVNASNTRYSINMPYLWGNSFLTYVMEGEDPELWDELQKYNESAINSKGLGFLFDPSEVSSELTALTNVRNEYAYGLETGSVDPERYLPEFIERLREAGIDKYIAEKQKQFDEWNKNK